MLEHDEAADAIRVSQLEDTMMIKALFWCFLALFSQLWLLSWVDRRVVGMRFGEEDEALPEKPPEGLGDIAIADKSSSHGTIGPQVK